MENKLSTPQITTLKAELRIVQIGNKQMTISVFKQLYEELCYDDNYRIIYPIWGKVNREEAIYCIFQKGNELRKMKLPEMFRLLDFYRLFTINVIEDNPVSMGNHEFYFGCLYEIKNGKSIAEILNSRSASSGGEKIYTRFLSYPHEYRIEYGDLSGKENASKIHSLFTKEELELMQIELRVFNSVIEAQRKMVADLNASPQLFIAV